MEVSCAEKRRREVNVEYFLSLTLTLLNHAGDVAIVDLGPRVDRRVDPGQDGRCDDCNAWNRIKELVDDGG